MTAHPHSRARSKRSLPVMPDGTEPTSPDPAHPDTHNGQASSPSPSPSPSPPARHFSGRWKHTIHLTWHAITPSESQNAATIAKYMPLVAAIIAPLSTLLDIAGLTQPWFGGPDGKTYKDSAGCITLSSIGLFLNVIANLLLLMRFSGGHLWRRGASLSLLFWLGKTIIALINVFYFGLRYNPRPGYAFTEGFWCAVASVIMAGIISICLGFNYFLAIGRVDVGDGEELRVTGRKFLFSVTFFMFLVGMQGLAYCRLEGWSYLDSIYFSIQCALTVGYGDLIPTTAVAKVLLFPFVVLTISQLANEVSIIISFVKNRSQEKRDEWRKRYSVAMHRQAIKRRPYATLIDEMSLIHQINLHQETMVQLLDLFWSGLSLAAFWLIGAVIFHYVEQWGFGNAVYAVMVLSVTIGFGDFTPKTPAGRVIWVVYALMAVPVVTNFAVQTVTGIMYTWSEHRFARSRFELEREKDPEIFAPHSHFILRYHEQWDSLRDKYLDTKGKAYVEIKGLHQIRPALSPDWSSKKGPSPTVGRSAPESFLSKPTSPSGAGSPPTTAAGTPLLLPPSTRAARSPASAPLLTPTFSPSAKSPPSSPNASRRSHRSSKAEERVIDAMLEDPDTHDDVVESLGSPSVVDDADSGATLEESPADTLDGSPDSNAYTSANPSPNDKEMRDMQQKVDAIEHEDDARPSSETRIPSENSFSPKLHIDTTAMGKMERRAERRSEAAEGKTLSDTPSSLLTSRPSLEVCSPAMGPRLLETDSEGKHSQIGLTGDPMVDANRMELYLVKELVDRVTRLEAQSRQMLIDTMDQDIARTLLLADRNLQIRDAFQLYGNNIDLAQTYKDEAERTRAEREQRAKEKEELHRQAAVIEDTETDDDMLSRVRRYRNTFAEVLVISSMLLKLEGDDLKRFERWHVGDLHHAQTRNKGKDDRKVSDHTNPTGFFRSQAQRMSNFVSGDLTGRRKDGDGLFSSFGTLTKHDDSGDYNHGIPRKVSKRLRATRSAPASGTPATTPMPTPGSAPRPSPLPSSTFGLPPDPTPPAPRPTPTPSPAPSAPSSSDTPLRPHATRVASDLESLRERRDARHKKRRERVIKRHVDRFMSKVDADSKYFSSWLHHTPPKSPKGSKKEPHGHGHEAPPLSADKDARRRERGELGVESEASAAKRRMEMEELARHDHRGQLLSQRRKSQLEQLERQMEEKIDFGKQVLMAGHEAHSHGGTPGEGTHVGKPDAGHQTHETAEPGATHEAPEHHGTQQTHGTVEHGEEHEDRTLQTHKTVAPEGKQEATPEHGTHAKH